MVTTDTVIVAGEINSTVEVNAEDIVRKTVTHIGYNSVDYGFNSNTLKIYNHLHQQSPDINQGVVKDDPGAGDQGIMFGYAVKDGDNYMPLTLELSHLILKELDVVRKEKIMMLYLRPDAKSQVTIEYDENDNPVRIDTIVVSTSHDEFAKTDSEMQFRIKEDIKNIIIPRVLLKLSDTIRKLFKSDIKYLVNPTGKFVICGPNSDTGLTNRKIIVDTYGGRGSHGGGGTHGKDVTKQDRSSLYMSRYIAKNMVAAGICDEVLIQVSYAIGYPEPISIYVKTFGKNNVNLNDYEISDIIYKNFATYFKPKNILHILNLKNPIYSSTTYGEVGKEFYEKDNIQYFTWEKLDLVDKMKELFINQKELITKILDKSNLISKDNRKSKANYIQVSNGTSSNIADESCVVKE